MVVLDPNVFLHGLSQNTISPEEALKQASQALKSSHHPAQWAVPACLALWKMERYQEALQLHSQYQTELEHDGNACLVAGICAKKLGKHELEAEQYLKKAIRLMPDRADALYNLANLYSDTDRHQEAIDFYKQSIALDPFSPNTWHNQGISLREIEEYAQAKRALITSIQLNPTNADVWCNLGLIAHAHEDYALAKRCYLQSIHVDQQHAEGWVNMGMALLDELRPEEALTALEKGHKLNPRSPEALFNMALTLLLLADFKEGWRLYESRFTTKQFEHTVVPSKGHWITTIQDINYYCNNSVPLLKPSLVESSS